MPVTATATAADQSATSNEAIAQKAAVLNPYTLAELVVGRRLDWKQLANRPQLLEDILQTPYEELFDPKFGGPLYTGLRLNEKLQLERVHSPLLDVEITIAASDLDRDVVDPSAIRVLGDIGKVFQVADVAALEVRRAELVGFRNLAVTVRLPDREYYQRLATILSKDIVRAIAFDPDRAIFVDGWTPPNATWSDEGRFFNEAAEFFDPIQGNVANCYYIAALAAVAWAMPSRIRHMTRATGLNNQLFTNQVTFYRPDSGGQVDRDIEVTDSIVVGNGGGIMYARSSEGGEIWPAVYEKAYAKLLTNVTNDHPDILATAWGDCVWATAQLTGGRRFYYDTASRTGDQLWDLVRGNSLSYRTFNPMTAWTYSSGDASEKKIVYGDANIVASHCYTVLGWAYRNGVKYIILRNPWGNTEAGTGTLSGTVSLFDISWWRPINLTTVDGTFALEANAFKTYFAGLGVAK
jgi:hypothetical protein